LGIFFSSGNLNVNGALTVNGTLIVKGALTNSGTIAIVPVSPTPNTNLPALVVSGKLTVNGAGRTLSTNGVVYIDQGITGVGSTSTSTITINGALLIRTGGINAAYAGHTSVVYNSAYTNIPNFDLADADWDPTSGIKIISWNE
jgi:hypothetical protein